MFFLNFLIFSPFFFDLEPMLSFQYFPELTGNRNRKKTMLKKFFFSRIKECCHSFRYTFPLKTAGAIVMGSENFLDYAFETKYKVKVQHFESNFLIGRLNIVKGAFVAINFPYKLEKFTSFSTFLISEKLQLSFHLQEEENLEQKNLDFLSFSNVLGLERKTSFSLCWSISRISSALSGFFFNPFVISKRKLYYFNQINFKKSFFNPNSLLNSKKKILRRLGFHIFRSSHAPLAFPFKFFERTAKIVNEGIKSIFFSLGYFLKGCFYFSPDIFSWYKIKSPNLEFDYIILILQKKKEKKRKIEFPFSSRFFLSYRVKEQLEKLPKKLDRNFSKSKKENIFKNYFFLKEEEKTWNNELSLSEIKINFFSRKKKKKLHELSDFISPPPFNSLNCYLSKKKKLDFEKTKNFILKNQF